MVAQKLGDPMDKEELTSEAVVASVTRSMKSMMTMNCDEPDCSSGR
jgi:hypothetical protein